MICGNRSCVLFREDSNLSIICGPFVAVYDKTCSSVGSLPVDVHSGGSRLSWMGPSYRTHTAQGCGLQAWFSEKSVHRGQTSTNSMQMKHSGKIICRH